MTDLSPQAEYCRKNKILSVKGQVENIFKIGQSEQRPYALFREEKVI